MSDDDISDPLKAYRPRASGAIETKAHRIAQLSAKQAELNSLADLVLSLELQAERLAQPAEVERKWRALGEKP